MAYNNISGAKYEATKNLNRAELKALMLADLKAAQKADEIPAGVRVTLREGRGSFSLTATIRGFSGILNPERVQQDVEQPNVFVPEFMMPRYTKAATALQQTITSILEAYNYDRSEIETDYFNVRFYLHVEFKREEERAERELLSARPSNVVTLPVVPVESAQERFLREAGAL